MIGRAILCLLLLALPACGGSEPTAKQWLELAQAHYQDVFTTDFEMRFDMTENGRKVHVEHKGQLAQQDVSHYRLQAGTSMVLPDLNNQAMHIDNLQVADGEWLWMQSGIVSVPEPIVLKRKLTDLESLAVAEDQGANQLSPADLHPLFLWQMATAHCSFQSVLKGAVDQVELEAVASGEFLAAIGHRDAFWQPRKVQITLHRATSAPLGLRLLREDGSVAWQLRFTFWGTKLPQDCSFDYQAPEGAQVINQ